MALNIINGVLLLQLFLWFNLYHSEIELGKWYEALFYIYAAFGVGFLYLTGFSVDFFTTTILIQYVFFVAFSVTVFTRRFGFRKALCLGFLVTFFNSFFWELFYHVYEFQLWYPVSLGFSWWYVRAAQWIRIMPLVFLRRNFIFWDTRAIQAALVVSFILSAYRFSVYPSILYLHFVHRFICLTALVYTIYISPQKQHKGVEYEE